ncbi:PREDICTED: F-box protein SKIP22-like [Tarenaya hassleriana]|uniref:F-box protein SKIP22-like n=1 Tax=Tarenaya hassleriana TaxID=28532 RepID=UPI00053CA7C2|nr:PREDICTED: F-box protein SKIP22-like [Tarenaya hassleriana]
MKLRLRNHETRETLKCEFLETCSLHDLRRRIDASSPSSVHISLNRKDELVSSSPDDTLRSLGLTSGDLVYYALEPSVFHASSQDVELASSTEAQQSPVRGFEDSAGKLEEQETLFRDLGTKREIGSGSTGIGSGDLSGVPENPDMNIDIQKQANTDLNFGVEEPIEGSTGAISGTEGHELMDVEFDGADYADSKRLSEPFFLKKVLIEECTDKSEAMILVMAVHAVMLESRFVLLDPTSRVWADKFTFFKETMSSISLIYTLPELITRNHSNETVSLKFQSLGPMLVVYGSLGGTSSHRVCLDSRRFVPTIDLVMDTMKSDKEGSSSMYREVFEFWRMVKDGVAMPLLIGLCDMCGLELPPCLMRLPTDIKIKILESLPGVDVARLACVCSDMRYVTSNNNLWKQKCLEEYGDLVNKEEDAVSWKAKFAAYRENDRRRNNILVCRRMRPNFWRLPQIRQDPFPMGFPPVTWYDRERDRLPAGHPFQLGQRGPGLGQLRGRNLSPRCNLGGLN